MKIFDWMLSKMKHEMNYYSKVPQGKGGSSIDIPGMAPSGNKSTDQYFGTRKSSEALLLVELSNEAPAAAVYHVLGLDGILTIGTLGSSPHHLGKEAVILEVEENADDGEEELAVAQHETPSSYVSQVQGKAKNSLVLPRVNPILQTNPGIMQLEAPAPVGEDEAKCLVEPLLLKGEVYIVEELEKGRITLRDLFMLSDEEYGHDQNGRRNGSGKTPAMDRNDSSLEDAKGGRSAKWQNTKTNGSSGVAAPPPVNWSKGQQCTASRIGVEPIKKKEKDGTSSKFRRVLRRMTRKKIHPDVDRRRAEVETSFPANKDIHKEGIQQDHEINKDNIKCVALFN